jgi:hypothetical protein
VVVGGEVDCGERDVTEEAGGGAFVEAYEAEVAHYPHGGAAGGAFDVFGDFALDLEADFDDFEGVGEYLFLEVELLAGMVDRGGRGERGTYDLTSSCTSTSQNLMRDPDLSILI